MKKNTAGQFWHVKAFNALGAVSGDAANITATIALDDGARAATNDVNPTEIGTTGEYVFALTQAETNAYKISVIPVSGTSGVQVMGFPNVQYTFDTEAESTIVVPRSVIDEYDLPEDTDIVYRGTEWEIRVEDLPDLYDATAIYLGIKDGDVPDSEAILQVKYTIATDTTVILRVNGQSPEDADIEETDAVITKTEYTTGDVDLTRFVAIIEGEATAKITPTELITASSRPGLANVSRRRGYLVEWKLVGDKDIIVKHGYIMVRPDINRATS